MKKTKIIGIIDYTLFLLFFIVMIIPLMISGLFLRPIRYYKYISNKVKNKKLDSYYY